MRTLGADKPINLAFLGCGLAARLHSKTLSGFRQDVRCYYASRDRGKAISYNQKYRGHGYFESYDAALDEPNIDVVFVVTPPAYHLDLTLKAMRAGKHVFIEKPPFLHSADFDTVRKAQAETGSRVFVAENYFYKPLAFKLREIISAGLIGEILFVHVNALKTHKTNDWHDDPTIAGGGALFEGGIHWINFVANLGLPIKTVCGFRPGEKEGTEKSILVAIGYATGAVGVLSHSWEIPSALMGLRKSKIYGREGSIMFESNGLLIIVLGRKKRLIIPNLGDLAGYKAMLRDFIHSLRSGKEPQMNLDIAQNDLRLIETIYQSLNH